MARLRLDLKAWQRNPKYQQDPEALRPGGGSGGCDSDGFSMEARNEGFKPRHGPPHRPSTPPVYRLSFHAAADYPLLIPSFDPVLIPF